MSRNDTIICLFVYLEWITTYPHFVTIHGVYSTEYEVCKSTFQDNYYDSMARLAAFLINHNGLFGHVPLDHATEFELAVALIWYTLYRFKS